MLVKKFFQKLTKKTNLWDEYNALKTKRGLVNEQIFKLETLLVEIQMSQSKLQSEMDRAEMDRDEELKLTSSDFRGITIDSPLVTEQIKKTMKNIEQNMQEFKTLKNQSNAQLSDALLREEKRLKSELVIQKEVRSNLNEKINNHATKINTLAFRTMVENY